MPIPFNAPDPIYPTWGQSVGSGLDRFVQNYAMARKEKREADLLDHQLNMDQQKLIQAERERIAAQANFQATHGTYITPETFSGVNAQVSAGTGGIPYRQDIIDEAERIRVQGQEIRQKKATERPRSERQAYIDSIYARYKSDPSTVTDEEKQIAGITSKRTVISAETAKLIENAQSGLRALDDMEAAINEDPSVYRYAAGGQLGASIRGTSGQKYLTAKKIASDIVTRLRTGAALNESEQKFYDSLSPGLIDTSDSAKYKIEQMRDFYSGVVNRLQAGSFQEKAPGNGRAIALTGDKAKRLAELRKKLGGKK